jgi:N-methylhydantoinase A
VYLGGWFDVPVYALDDLPSGQTIVGAAIIESATTTVLFRPGDRAIVTAYGWLDIRIDADPAW